MNEQKKLSDAINEKELFTRYLTDYEVPKKIIKIAGEIDFGGIFNLLDANFDKLWNKIDSKKRKEILSISKPEFKEKTLHLLRQSIFNVLYIGIKDLKLRGINYDELNKGILEDFGKIMKNFFSVFEIEYELLNPSEKIKKDIPVKPVKEKEKVVEIDLPVKKRKLPKKIDEANYNPEDIRIYKKVLNEIERIGGKDEGTTLRKIALSVAETELGLKNKVELQLFYKSFIKFKRRQGNE